MSNAVGFQPRNTPAERRAFFDLERRLSLIEREPGEPELLWGTGSPEGARAAPVGTLYQRTDGAAGTSLYVKESGVGNVGWKPIEDVAMGVVTPAANWTTTAQLVRNGTLITMTGRCSNQTQPHGPVTTMGTVPLSMRPAAITEGIGWVIGLSAPCRIVVNNVSGNVDYFDGPVINLLTGVTLNMSWRTV